MKSVGRNSRHCVTAICRHSFTPGLPTRTNRWKKTPRAPRKSDRPTPCRTLRLGRNPMGPHITNFSTPPPRWHGQGGMGSCQGFFPAAQINECFCGFLSIKETEPNFQFFGETHWWEWTHSQILLQLIMVAATLAMAFFGIGNPHLFSVAKSAVYAPPQPFRALHCFWCLVCVMFCKCECVCGVGVGWWVWGAQTPPVRKRPDPLGSGRIIFPCLAKESCKTKKIHVNSSLRIFRGLGWPKFPHPESFQGFLSNWSSNLPNREGTTSCVSVLWAVCFCQFRSDNDVW